MALDTSASVMGILERLGSKYQFNVSELISAHGDVDIKVEGGNGTSVTITTWDGPGVDVALGVDMRTELNTDPGGEWLVWLEGLLEGIMANGFSEQIWRFRSGRHAGSRGLVETQQGTVTFRGNLYFWPFTKLLKSEVISYPPFDLAHDEK